MSNNKSNKALIISAFTSTAGIFIAKAIGLIYVIPFNSLVGEGNIVFYTYAYSIYEYMILVAAGGFPFAITMAVAKYYTLEDFISVKLIKKLGFYLLLGLGLITMAFLMFASPLFTKFIAPIKADQAYLDKINLSIIIMATALFFVPILGFFRGYYQGLKEFKSNALSQIIEQIARVTFILALGYLCVYILHTDRVVPVYLAIFSATFAAIIAIWYYYVFDKKHKGEIDELAKTQESSKKTSKELFRELIVYAMPFVLISFIANSNGIINLAFFNSAMAARGETIEFSSLTFSMLYFTCNKLTSIPQVLSIGFTAAIIPYMTSSFVTNNKQEMAQQMNDSLSVTSYIATPLVFCLIYFSLPIYYSFYGGENYVLGGEVLKWAALLGFSDAIFPSASSFMDATRLRKVHFLALLVALGFKLVVTYPAIVYFGYGATMLTTFTSTLIVFLIDLIFIYHNYRITFKRFFKNFMVMILGVAVMVLLAMALDFIGLNFIYHNRILNALILVIYGIIVCGGYVAFTALFKLPQNLFHIDIHKLLSIFKRRNKNV